MLEELDRDRRVEFVRDRNDIDVAFLLAHLPTDDAVELLRQLDEQRSFSVLSLLPEAKRDQVRGLLGFSSETAGGLMASDFVCLGDRVTVGAAIGAVRTATLPARRLQAVYVSDRRNRLVGAIDVADLIRADDTESPLGLVATEIPAVSADVELPELARLMAEARLHSLPVTDRRGRMVGVLSLCEVAERLVPDGGRRQPIANS